MKLKRLSKQLLVIVLSLAVLSSTLMLQTFTTLADGVATGSWEGEEEAFAEGDGSAGNPYRIANAKQLAMLGKYVKDNNTAYNAADKHYILTSDISLNDTTDMGDTPWYERTDTNIKAWTYGQSQTNSFKGTFDGDGYVIRGLYMNGERFGGLFGLLDGNAVIKNLGIESSYILATNQAAAFASKVGGNVTFRNCYADSSVILSSGDVCGAFFGQAYCTSVTVADCYSGVTVISTTEGSGSVCGIVSNGNFSMTRCYSSSARKIFGFTGSNNPANYQLENVYAVDNRGCWWTGYNPAIVGVTKVALDKMTGEEATFSMPELDYTKKWVVNPNGTPTLKVFTHPVDTANPTLSGEIVVTPVSKEGAAVTWPKADDDLSSDTDIVYTLYRSLAPITDVNASGVETLGSFEGKTYTVLEDLIEGTTYYFGVIAEDLVNKKSALLTAGACRFEYTGYDNWDGTIAEEFTVGSGSANDPYIIINAEELAHLASLCSKGNADFTKGKYFELAVNINLNDVSNANWKKNSPKEWTVGTADALTTTSFFGTFDGKGNIINGLYISDGAKTYNGLLPGVSGSAVIKNLGIDNSYISAGEETYSGFIAGYRNSTTSNDGVVIETSYVGSGASVKGGYAGGFLGGASATTTIKNTYSKATVEGTNGAGSFIGDYPYPNVSITVEGSYTTTTTPLVALTGKFTKATYKDSYTVGVADDGLATRTLEQMTGDTASNYMRVFDFVDVWQTVEDGTPELAIFAPPREVVYEYWHGDIATGFAEGSGTETDPYIISTGSELAFLARAAQSNDANYNTKHYKLKNDIVLNNIYVPNWYEQEGLNSWVINSQSGAFKGTLDGDGYVIKGLYKKGSGHTALFSCAGKGAVIKNLGIESSYFEVTGNTAGTFASKISGPVAFSNCYVADTVTVIGNTAGGFVGQSWFGGTVAASFTDCYSAASIKSTTADSWWQPLNQGAFVGIVNNKADPYNFTRCYSATNMGFIGNNRRSDALSGDVYTNCYTISTYDAAIPEIIQVSLDNMKGDAARTNMPALQYASEDNPDNPWTIVNGETPKLTIFLSGATDFDTTAPTFPEGKFELADVSKISLTVKWTEAADDFTPSAFIVYNAYYSESPITEANLASATSLGSFTFTREATITGADISKTYYFAVSATDEAGNTSYLFDTEGFKPKASENKVWSGKVAGYYEEGTGTETDPYIIANAEQLAYFVKNATQATTAGKYFAIVNDIYLNDVSAEKWMDKNPNEWAYGNSVVNSSSFQGTLDGRGHVINGLYAQGYGAQVGLVSQISGYATVKNLGIVNSYLDIENSLSNVYVGSFAGSVKDAGVFVEGDETKQGVRFIGCFVDETVEVNVSSTKDAFGGGFAGAISQGRNRGNNDDKDRRTTFSDCYAGARVTGAKAYIWAADVYAEKETVVFERCFSHVLNQELFNNYYKDATVWTDCYSADKTVDGVTRVNIVDMIGKDADKALSKLDFNGTWVTTSKGSPVLKAFTVGRTAAEYEPFALDRQPVTVSFAVGGGVEVEPLVGLVGQKLTLPTTTREGFVFEGWYLYAADSPLAYPIDYFPAYDITLFAKWRDLATLRLDFESYPYRDAGEDGLGEDHEWFRPGVTGYNADYVHGGGRSLHRIGELDTEQSFQLFDLDSNKLEVGKKYELTMWVYADKVTSGKIMLESSDRLKISKKSTVIADIADVTALKQGEWQEVKITFTAQNPYVLIRTSGSNSLYFDDVTIYEKGVGDLINTGTDTGNKTEGSEIGKTGESNAIVICFVVFAVSALMMAVVILLKKKQFRGEK